MRADVCVSGAVEALEGTMMMDSAQPSLPLRRRARGTDPVRCEVEARQRGVDAQSVGQCCRARVADLVVLQVNLCQRGVDTQRIRQRNRNAIAPSFSMGTGRRSVVYLTK